MTKKVTSSLLIFALLVLLFSGCSGKGEYRDQAIYGMDTYITLRLSTDGISDSEFKEISEEASLIIAKNEKLMSAYDSDSQLYTFNNGADMILSPDSSLLSVLDTAERMTELTGGAYLHTIGALSFLWNVTDGGPVPADEDIAAAMEHLSPDCLDVTDAKITKDDSECKLDLGGVAKGYTAQEIVEFLAEKGVSYGLVSMGGNIGVFGEKKDGEAFKVGICDPADTSAVAGYLNINSGFISVSGSYERFFEENGQKYHHIIDPKTGRPAESGLVSVAVWCQSGAVADALSTALFVMGEQRAIELYRSGKIDFEAVLITENGEIVLTDGIADGAFEAEGEKYTIRTIK